MMRVAAIGVSHWHSLYGPAYLQQLSLMPTVQIVGLQDPNSELVSICALAINSSAARYTDYRDMLRIEKPEFVLVLGRPDTMAEAAHHLLDSGIPFALEKPGGWDANQVRTIANTAKSRNLFAAALMPLRYTTFVETATAMMADGAFGQLAYFYMRMNRLSPMNYIAWNCAWMLDPQFSNGGSLRNLGTNGFDLFLALTHHSARVVGAQVSSRAFGLPVEDYASVLVRSEDGVVGTIEVGNTYPTASHSAPDAQSSGVSAAGDDMLLKLGGCDAMLTDSRGVLTIVTRDGERSWRPEGRNSSQLALLDIFERLRSGEQPSVGVEDCFHAVRLVEDAYLLAAHR